MSGVFTGARQGVAGRFQGRIFLIFLTLIMLTNARFAHSMGHPRRMNQEEPGRPEEWTRSLCEREYFYAVRRAQERPVARKKAIEALDPRFVEAYTREQLYMREMLQEFAQDHPKVARRLGIQAGEIGDPYVERLVQAFAWEAARASLWIDAAFPEFTLPGLETVYPNYTRPTPSISIVRLHQGFRRGGGSVASRRSAAHVRVRRGTLFQSDVPPGESAQCIFSSCQEVMLYPLEITHAKLTGVPPDIPALTRSALYGQVQGALRLTLRVTNAELFSSMENPDRLPIYLAGDEAIASHLFELLHSSVLGVVVGAPGMMNDEEHPPCLTVGGGVADETMEPGACALPPCGEKWHGFNLLHEFFACPSRFYFFTLTQLQKGLDQLYGQEAEIVILLDRPPGALAHQVDASRFALFCTPAINLFPGVPASFPLLPNETESLVRPDLQRPSDYEVYSIHTVQAAASKDAKMIDFLPRYRALIDDEGNAGRYFSARREVIAPIAKGKRRYRTQAPYTPSLMYLSLLNEYNEPYVGMQYAEVLMWLTNADLPGMLECNGQNDLRTDVSMPVSGVGLLRTPSRAWPPLAQGDEAWRLLSLLNMHASVFMVGAGENAVQALRNRLNPFVQPWDDMGRRMVDAIAGFRMTGINCPILDEGQLRFGRATGICLTMDESGLEGFSPYLFARVLERWLARTVSEQSFIRMELHSVQRGLIARWPARRGTRSGL